MPRKQNSPIDKAKAYEVAWNQVAPLFEAARPYANASFVYVIGEADDGPLKIGFSKDPIGRLRGMQTGNPRRLRIEYALVGEMPTEKLLHELWEPHAIVSASHKGLPGVAPGTEWFNPTARAELLPIIEDAVHRQIALLQPSGGLGFEALDQAVRDAHADSGYVPQVYDPTRRLAQGLGYAVSRSSRI